MPEAITYNQAAGRSPSAAIPAAHIPPVPPAGSAAQPAVPATGIAGTSGAADAAASLGGFREAVCMNAGRVYDSCSSKDCLEDLPVYLSCAAQAAVDGGNSVKCRSIDVLHVAMDVESVPFNNGFYSVDMTFYFLVTFDIYGGAAPGCGCTAPQTVQGLSVFSKKVILFGSEGSVRSFRSDSAVPCALSADTPIAQVQTVEPICLGLKVCEQPKPECDCESVWIPPEIEALIGGSCAGVSGKYIYLTIGLFSIVSLERDLQMMVPVYDFCVPEKECVSASSEDPCELFQKIRFPVSEFFPPRKETCE